MSGIINFTSNDSLYRIYFDAVFKPGKNTWSSPQLWGVLRNSEKFEDVFETKDITLGEVVDEPPPPPPPPPPKKKSKTKTTTIKAKSKTKS